MNIKYRFVLKIFLYFKIFKDWSSIKNPDLQDFLTPSPTLRTALPAIMLLNKLAANESNDILRNPRFCSSASFLIIPLTSFISKLDSSRELISL